MKKLTFPIILGLLITSILIGLIQRSIKNTEFIEQVEDVIETVDSVSTKYDSLNFEHKVVVDSFIVIKEIIISKDSLIYLKDSTLVKQKKQLSRPPDTVYVIDTVYIENSLKDNLKDIFKKDSVN